MASVDVLGLDGPKANGERGSAQKLLLAAVAEFSANGYRATTTRDIAKRAGMSPAGVYVHYQSKSDLLFEIVRAGQLALLKDVTDAVDRETEPVARVRALVAALVEWHARHYSLARIVQDQLHEVAEPNAAIVQELSERLVKLVRRELRAGTTAGVFEVDSPKAVVRAILSLAVDVARWYGPKELSPGKLGTTYADLVLRMLRPVERS